MDMKFYDLMAESLHDSESVQPAVGGFIEVYTRPSTATTLL